TISEVSLTRFSAPKTLSPCLFGKSELPEKTGVFFLLTMNTSSAWQRAKRNLSKSEISCQPPKRSATATPIPTMTPVALGSPYLSTPKPDTPQKTSFTLSPLPAVVSWIHHRADAG